MLKTTILLCALLISSLSHSDEWTTPDKPLHFKYNSLGTLALYGVYSVFGFSDPAEKAAITMIVEGAAKELLYDPNKSNPTDPSYKDMTSNLLGIGLSYVTVKYTEVLLSNTRLDLGTKNKEATLYIDGKF